MRRTLLVVVTLACAACDSFGSADTAVDDASSPIDAGPTSDAGIDDGAPSDGPDDAKKDGGGIAPVLESVITLGTSSEHATPVGVAIGTANVFLSSESGVVLSRSKDPAVTDLGTPIYGSLSSPQYLTLYGSEVFWAELGAGTITRAPVAGGGGKTVTGYVTGATGIALGGSTMWATAVSTGNIYSFPRDAFQANPTPVATVASSDRPVGIAVGGGLVYVALQAANEIVSFMVGNTNAGRTHVVDIDTPTGLAYDEAAGVFYATSKSGDPLKRGVYRWHLGDAKAQQVVQTDQIPAGIAFDDLYVYWVTRGTAGRIWRADKN